MADLRDLITGILQRRIPDSEWPTSFYGLTAAEISSGITPVSFIYPEGDIRRYGATLAAADNSGAINDALEVSGGGGNAAFVPGGTWNITASLSAAPSSSLYGMGAGSVIQSNSTTLDGLTFQSQGNVEKTRFFRDFKLFGPSSGTQNGISVDFSAASGHLVTGVIFYNVAIENFAQALSLRGLWQSAFIDCFLYNNYQGYLFHGQNIFIRIEGGVIQTRGGITGTGDRIGINVDSIAGETTQSLHIIAVQIDSYDMAISGGPMLYNVFENLDIAFASKYAINLAATSGQCVIRDCALQTNSASFATVGINLNDLGSAATDKVILDGNWITANQANASSVGIYVGGNQQGVVITNNRIGSSTSPFANGILSNGLSHNLFTQNNVIYATSVARSLSSTALNVSIGPDTIENGQVLGFSAGTPVGFAYFRSDSFPLTLTGMSSTVIGTCSYQANGHEVILSVPSAGITGPSNATTMTGLGLPSALWPITTQRVQCVLEDNGVNVAGIATVQNNGTITFGKDVTGAAFTNSGTKGVLGGLSYAYA